MNDSPKKSLAITLVTGFLIFIIAVVLPKFFVSIATHKIMVTQTLELLLSLLAIFILGKKQFDRYGFCLPRTGKPPLESLIKFLPVAAIALALGTVASLVSLFTGAAGNPVVKELSFPQIILFIWIFSSVIEEIFTRGFIQGHLSASGDNRTFRFLTADISRPALISAVFFACMHLVLFLSGADLKTTVIIFLFTLCLGLLAGHQRDRTGSLLPAIGVHMLGNIGGMLGGIIYAVYAILTGGKLPGM